MVEMRIPSELGWERAAVDVAASVAKHMGFPPQRIEDIKTAVAEATINAIEHGNASDKASKVVIILLPEQEKLEINIHDRAATPFDATRALATLPSLEEKLSGNASARGWGMFLIQSLVDEVEFSYTGTGNVVRMVIHLES
jgi:serine/threonine-protein kinase RsbW